MMLLHAAYIPIDGECENQAEAASKVDMNHYQSASIKSRDLSVDKEKECHQVNDKNETHDIDQNFPVHQSGDNTQTSEPSPYLKIPQNIAFSSISEFAVISEKNPQDFGLS